MWLVTALVFNALALQAGEQESQGEEMVLSSIGCCSGHYCLSCPVQSCCHSTLQVNNNFSYCVCIELTQSPLCSLRLHS